MYNEVEVRLAVLVGTVLMPECERQTLLRILGYARARTLTSDHVVRCLDVSIGWGRYAYEAAAEAVHVRASSEWAQSSDKPYYNTAQKESEYALSMALLYEEFARVLKPFSLGVA